jgi:hypothetical protein
MNNHDLKRYLASRAVRVVCADDLPSTLKRCQFWVVNTDKCGERGLHWVVFHFPSRGPLEFFDSLGNPPEYYHRRFQNILMVNGAKYGYFDSRIQSETSSLCGQYCIYFVLQRMKGRSMNSIAYDFNVFNTHANESLVSDFINDMSV